jgi:hypothetical protein
MYFFGSKVLSWSELNSNISALSGSLTFDIKKIKKLLFIIFSYCLSVKDKNRIFYMDYFLF